MGLLSGKKALVLGVANEKSIAWGITRALKEQGASIALTYLNDQLKKRVEPLAKEVDADFLCEVDVSHDEHLKNLHDKVQSEWGQFDILVHSLAFADRNELKKRFHETSREGFRLACDISAYSLVGLSHELKDLLTEDGSIIAMTYHGSRQVSKGYNVMGVAKAALEASSRYLADDLGQDGIRVNCISAGPIKTLAASGVPGLRQIFDKVEEKAPLRRNITTDDVGKTAAYLASDLSSGVTGQTIYVDSGMSIVQ